MLNTGRRSGTRPGRIIRANVVEPRHDSDDAPEFSEERNARLKFSALICRQPVLAVHFDVHELDERRSAHAGDPAAGFERHLSVLELDDPATHSHDLLSVSVEVHVAEEQNCIAGSVRARRDAHTREGNPSPAGGEQRHRGVAALIHIVCVSIGGERVNRQRGGAGIDCAICRRR